MVYVGIDIGGTQAKIGLVNLKGKVEKTAAYDVAFDGYDTPIMETVKKSLVEFLKENGVAGKNIAGIGVSATGQIDVKTGTVIGAAGHIKNWEGCEIKKELKEMFDVPVSVMNDANCAVLAEQWIGKAKGIPDVVMITVGTGVGGGIIADSKILCGVSGSAGELGHFTLRNNGRMCSCGNRGCYEQYASTTVLIKMIRSAVRKGEIPAGLFEDESINGKTIFAAYDKNGAVKNCVNKWIGYVADGLVGLVHIFDPGIVLVGGGVSVQEERFIKPLRELVKSRVMREYGKRLKLEAASLGNDAGMVGAVYYCMSNGN